MKHETITFFWRTYDSYNVVELHDHALEEAMKIAEEFGYSKPIWWKYWTYDNGFIYDKMTEEVKQKYLG